MTDVDERVDQRGDGRIVLYKRAGLKKPKWQARIRVTNSTGYKIATSKTDTLGGCSLDERCICRA